MFSNAILGSHDITTLIRDTEAHERALFQIDPSAKPQRHATRRGEALKSEPARLHPTRDNRHQSAVARVLGSDMMDEIRRSAGSSTGEVDINVLLRGAEILCNV